MTDRELVVTDDLAGKAVELFLEAEPWTVALSGGKTPEPVYERLATIDYDWEHVDFFLGDERCVLPNHPDSNYRMVKRTLMSEAPVRVHPMATGSGWTMYARYGAEPVRCDPDRYEGLLRSMFADAVPRFDLMFLGLGEDGHTCSLFPGDPALDVKDRLVVKVSRPDHERLTLTFPVLDAARLAVFLVAGEDKRDALRKLMDGDRSIPAARVAAERIVVLADPAAAGRSSA